MKTRKDLITEVLDLLGVTQTGQPQAPEDAQKVDDAIDGLCDELARRQILYVQSTDAIDDEYLTPIATMLASRIGPKFGSARDRNVEIAEEATLRSINRGPGVYQTMRTDYI